MKTPETSLKGAQQAAPLRPWAMTLLVLLLGILSACEDASTPEDVDGDGYSVGEGDCDDNNPAIHPGAAERCNRIDEDCDGQVDEGVPTSILYQDEDGDGFGSPSLPIQACGVVDGISQNGGDCNDDDALIHPGAPEQTDELDNDCDGMADELGTERYYRDADLDGFGSSLEQETQPTAGYVRSRGDCDDTDAQIRPGADDPADDGIDQDCGGTDGPQPHVGLSPTSLGSVQAALDQAKPNDLIWVGPGNYKEQLLRFNGNPATLISTHFASDTTLDGDGLGTVLAFDQGEQPSMVVDGFYLTGAPVTADGAINILDSSPTLRNLRIARNATSGVVVRGGSPVLIALELQANTGIDGGGIAVYAGTLTVAGASFLRNRASSMGGGILGYRCSLTVLDSYFDGNMASSGGGVAVTNGSAELSDLWLSHNLSTYEGGGIYVGDATATLDASHLEKNAAYTIGGGIYATSGTLEVSRSTLIENYAADAGGLGLYNVQATLENVFLLSNLAVYTGGAARSECGTLLVSRSTLVGNLSTLEGGGIAHVQCDLKSALRVSESILAWNAPSLLYLRAYIYTDLVVQVTRSVLYNPLGSITDSDIDEEDNLYANPLFVDWSPDRNPYNDDLHLRPGSPALDAGSGTDLDGTVADLGAYGGPSGDAYSQDHDQDQLDDGWETAYGTNPLSPDAQKDPDQDGLTNLEELASGTRPLLADTDGDGHTDGAEAADDGDPTDWFLRPGQTRVIGRIPLDFPTVQAGIDTIRTEGSLSIAAGIYTENLDVALKTLTLEGAGMESTTLQGPQEGSVVTAVAAPLTLSDLAITGGFFSQDSDDEYTNGAGLAVAQGDAELTRVWLHDNVAANGAGAAFYKGSGLLTDCKSTWNVSYNDGGGLAGYSSSLSVQGGEFSDNSAAFSGGGISSDDGTLVVVDAVLERNQASYGGGLNSASGSASLTNLTVSQNKAGDGGGIMLHYSTATLAGSDLFDNEATTGGGLYITGESVRIENSLIRQNKSTYSVAVFCEAATLTASNVGILENLAVDFSGMQTSSVLLSQDNLVVMGNISEQAGAGLRLANGTQGELSGVQVTGNWGQPGFGALELIESNPAFAGAVVASNAAIGVLLIDNSVPSFLNSILAYNPEGNLMKGPGQGSQSMLLSYSNLYNPKGLPSTDTTTTNTSNRTLEPQFLSYDARGYPDDFHLTPDSPMVNTGAPGVIDRDGSKGDLGLYGGPLGGSWDRDQDGLPDYFWPGDWSDAPYGVDQGAYDEDDTDAL